MKISILTIFLLACFGQNIAQEIRRNTFIVEVVRLMPINSPILCYATIISTRHVLTAASCVTSTPLNQIRIGIPGAITRLSVHQVFVHPGYRLGQLGNSNAAVLTVNAIFDTINLPLLPVNNLPSNITCNLFGWGQQQGQIPRNEVVPVYGAEFCNPGLPQVSCSTFASADHPTCSAMIGSPVLCDGNARFTGFLTSDSCVPHQNGFMINYQSVASFRTWYEEVVRIDNAGQAVFVAHVMEFIPTNIATQRIRCAGTIISENHLLTAATCVTVPENSTLVIGVQATWAGQGLSTDQADVIFIHPNFVATQIRNSNIAVIRTRQSFAWVNNIPPMNLGTLPANNVTDGNLCHVVFSEGQQESRRDIVAVYRPQYCYNNLPQVYCSIIDIGSLETCSALQGSPVVCGDRGAVAGFVLTDRACSSLGDLKSMDFHSVGDFSGWIENVSGADKLAKLSVLAILSALLISVKNFL